MINEVVEYLLTNRPADVMCVRLPVQQQQQQKAPIHAQRKNARFQKTSDTAKTKYSSKHSTYANIISSAFHIPLRICGTNYFILRALVDRPPQNIYRIHIVNSID